MAEIPCLPLVQLTDGPLFGTKPGTLSELTNMELRPGGYAEARGGMEKLKPLGGTQLDAIASGGYSDVLQTSTSYGWVRTHDSAAVAGSQWSENKQLHQGGWRAFGGVSGTAITVGNSMHWGADLPFSRIGISLSVAGAWAAFAGVYEYWNGSAWTALTTAETIDFTVLRTPQFASWTMPTDWVAVHEGDALNGKVIKYWMRIRVATATTVTVHPCVGVTQGFWSGVRDLYVATQSPRSGAASGKFMRQGQNGSAGEWYTISSTLFSGNASPTRMVEYRGRVILVNGKDVKRWDGANFVDLGITGNLPTGTIFAVAGTLGAGIWRYYAALGDGPCQNIDAYADRQDAQALYGPGRAWPITSGGATPGGEIITVVAQGVQITALGGEVGASSSFYIYRTDDLTNVPVADRANAPAYLIQSFRLKVADSGGVDDAYEQDFGLATGTATPYVDNSLSQAFPLQEAFTFDIAPPGVGTSRTRPKYLLIYQNRLLLGDEETWYISDPFQPDRFTTKSTTGYIRLAKATGGRHMGGVEFADQAVLFTEDQTWGLTNVDLDVPQLYPIHPGVGCIAPDSIAVGDGVLMWLAKDGVYAWDGSRAGPQKVSVKMKETFGAMSYERHGGSKATIHKRRYDLRLSNPDYSSIGSAWRFAIETGEWSLLSHAGFASSLFPLATIHAPLDANDSGFMHPLWGKVDYGTGAGEYGLYMGELTTQDNGVNYSCSATMHFQIPPSVLLTPTRVKAYYQASNGWGTPSLTFTPSSVIGSGVGALNAGTPDIGSDYSVLGGTFTEVGRGSSDLQVKFSVSSAASGSVNQQRLFGALLEGDHSRFRRGSI